MLRKIFLLVLIVFLTACSSPNKVPVAVMNTATSIPSTATITSSPVPSETPVPPTATEAIDPATGWKITRKLADGTPVLLSPDLNQEVILAGSAYLINHDERPYILPNSAFQMQVFYLAQDGFTEPSISQPATLTSAGNNFTSYFMAKLGYLYYGDHRNLDTAKDANNPSLINLLQNEGLRVTVDNGTTPGSFVINKDTKYRVYMMPMDKMPAGSQEWKSKNYAWFAKPDGKNAIVYMSMPNAKSKDDFIYYLMYPLAAMVTPNQSPGLYTPVIQQYAAGDQDYNNADSLRSFQVSSFP